jgi:hypothetical protein
LFYSRLQLPHASPVLVMVFLFQYHAKILL